MVFTSRTDYFSSQRHWCSASCSPAQSVGLSVGHTLANPLSHNVSFSSNPYMACEMGSL